MGDVCNGSMTGLVGPTPLPSGVRTVQHKKINVIYAYQLKRLKSVISDFFKDAKNDLTSLKGGKIDKIREKKNHNIFSLTENANPQTLLTMLLKISDKTRYFANLRILS